MFGAGTLFGHQSMSIRTNIREVLMLMLPANNSEFGTTKCFGGTVDILFYLLGYHKLIKFMLSL